MKLGVEDHLVGEPVLADPKPAREAHQQRPAEPEERDEPTLEITQAELAATLALSRQTVSRAFRDLASEGAIKPERRRVSRLDLEKLRGHLPR